MIPYGVEIFVGLDPIDLRWSFDRLSGIVTERIGREARCGALFVFFGKRRAIKVLFSDGTGMCVFYKRLDRGTFRLPDAEPGSASVAIDERALDDLLDGIDVQAKAKKAPRIACTGARIERKCLCRSDFLRSIRSPAAFGPSVQSRRCIRLELFTFSRYCNPLARRRTYRVSS